jgi:hypothetical protein
LLFALFAAGGTCSPSGSPCCVHCIVIAVLLLLLRLHMTDCQQRQRPHHWQQFVALTPGASITSLAIKLVHAKLALL